MNNMLAASEDASIRGVVRRDELQLCDDASWMRLLDSAYWHGVRDYIERVVHVLLEEALELVTDEKSLGRLIHLNSLPNDVKLALSWKSLILRSIKEFVLPDLLVVGAAISPLLIVVLELRRVRFSLVCAKGGSQTGKSDCALHNLNVLYSTS